MYLRVSLSRRLEDSHKPSMISTGLTKHLCACFGMGSSQPTVSGCPTLWMRVLPLIDFWSKSFFAILGHTIHGELIIEMMLELFHNNLELWDTPRCGRGLNGRYIRGSLVAV